MKNRPRLSLIELWCRFVLKLLESLWRWRMWWSKPSLARSWPGREKMSERTASFSELSCKRPPSWSGQRTEHHRHETQTFKGKEAQLLSWFSMFVYQVMLWVCAWTMDRIVTGTQHCALPARRRGRRLPSCWSVMEQAGRSRIGRRKSPLEMSSPQFSIAVFNKHIPI